MFFITNNKALIKLEGCTFTYGSRIFLDAEETSELGKSGSNGGEVTLTLTNQNIEGDFVVDSYSSLTINMVNSSIKGKINNNKISSTIAITLDAASTITLTGNSYISSLSNSDSTGSNIIKGTYSFADYNGNEFTASGTGTSTTSSTTTAPTSTNTQISTTTPITNYGNTTDNDLDFIRVNSSGKSLSISILYILLILF